MKKSNRRRLALVGLVVVAAAVVAVVVALGATQKSTGSSSSQTSSPRSSQPSSTGSSSTNSSTKTITAAEVAQHSSASSCWTIINGRVYDITKEISIHPGGDKILQACGRDGTAAFATGGKGNQGHSSSAQQQLDSYQIGVAN